MFGAGLRLVCLAACATCWLAAQSEIGSGTLSGTVLDATGAAISGAKVVVTNQNTGLKREFETNDSGVYTFVRLPVGRYTLTVEKTGFKTAIREDLVINVGSVGAVDVTLEVGATQERITVTADATVVETTRSQTSTVVGEKLVRDLPINGRNFLDFTTLSPGVVRDPRGGDLSFGGLRGTNNSFLIDGVDSNNLFFGQTTGRQGVRNPYAVSQDAVQEFQVNTNGYAAEVGRAGGGVVNVITKSGTNELHGTAFFFYRDTNLNANNSFNKSNGRDRAPYKFRQFGGNLGGPIRKDKLFYFFNYDGQRNSEPVVLVPPPGILAVLPTLSPAAQQAYQQLTSRYYQNYSRGLNNDVFLAKVDWNASRTQTVGLRWNGNRFTGRNYENAGAQRAVEATGDSKVITDSFVATYTRILGTTRVWDIRYNFTRDDQPGFANSDAPETTVQQGGQNIIVFGRNNFSPRYTNSKRNQVISTLTNTVGRHTVKFGADFNFERIANFFPGQFSGVYLFTSLQDFVDRRPATFQQALPGPNTPGPLTNPNIDEFAFFAQDQWRATDQLTLNYGLRYDIMRTAKPPVRNPHPQLEQADIRTDRLDLDTNNFGPRLGVAYRVFKNSDRLVLRGGWGMYYARTPAILLGTVHSNNGLSVQNYLFSGAAIPVTYPNILTAIPPTGRVPVNIFAVEPNYELGRTQQWSFNIEGRVSDFVITLGYLGVRGDQLTRSRDRNLAPAQLFAGTLCSNANAAEPCANPTVFPYFRRTAPRPLSAFNRITQVESSASSLYNGTFIQLTRRFKNNFELQTSYTFSKVLDNAPEATAVLPGNAGDDAKIVWDTLNPNLDKGHGDADITHRWVMSGVWDLAWANRMENRLGRYVLGGWQVSSIVQAQSGRVFSPRINLDLNNDGNLANERVPFAARNSLRLPALATLDFRISKDVPLAGDGRVKIRLIGEAFNLTNRTNITGQNGVQLNANLANFQFRPNAAFRFTTSTGDPRILQLAAKILF
ncbi:MAG: TonB-dependent receptor [Bryobacteraceae bacterium]|nr:TonB-dependent receptor [Bryobacteraceae bacterium]MDW8376673.1 TonB-dependent receptor [Bryobacterales bacterium]